jgi:hypothetical protein
MYLKMGNQTEHDGGNYGNILRNQGSINALMEAVRTSETSVYFKKTTRRSTTSGMLRL